MQSGPSTSDTRATAARLRRIADLPGPRGLPLLGNALQVQSSRMHQIVEQWSRVHGEYFRIRIASREMLVVANGESIAAILRDRPDTFQRTPRLSAMAQASGFGGVFSSNGQAWRRQRPMVMASFDPAHIKSYFPTLVKVTERFARRWQRAARAGAAIDLQADLMRYTVDVTAGLAFGADINTLESDREVIQQHLDKVLPALFKRLMAPFDYWRYIRLPADRAFDRHLTALRAAVEGFIAQARDRISADPSLRERPTNLIEAMIVARDAAGSELTDADVSGNVFTMLLAGEDTTANTLAWLIWLLARHPEAARRARDEVRAALGPAGVPQTLEQCSTLDYVEACVHETMRLKPVAPIILQHTLRDTVVADIDVPAGSLLMCLMRPPSVDARQFPQPEAFKPERWLAGANPGQAASSAKRVSMPFGAGPRICPGRYLALLEMKMVTGMLLGGFEIESVSTEDGAEVREHLALTMAPVGLRLKLQAIARQA